MSKNKLDLLRRPRRLRHSKSIRNLVQETELSVRQLIQPIFIHDGEHAREKIESMPGLCRLSISELIKECKEIINLGLGGVALFPKVDNRLKSDLAKEALNPNNLIYTAIKELNSAFPDLNIIADIALDPYTINGHDGIIKNGSNSPLNDETVEILKEMSLLSATAGATIVAPSDMMDGRVSAIRRNLDQNDYESVLILSYAVKFASSLYGPFRNALGVKPENAVTIDKSSYQLNPKNRRESMIEAVLDEDEGADILMIKPAGQYLDIIREIRNSTDLNLAAYQVSGEYAQIVAAAEKGFIDLKKSRNESLISIKRAGADMIFSYFAKDYANDLI